MIMARREIFVYADWKEVEGPVLMGTLTSDLLRGKEVFSFEYDKAWLDCGHAFILDPDLQLFKGPQYLSSDNKINFGLFLDSAPDRWGKVLMQRREAAKARLEERKPRKLFETDYLLGVYDGHRMGGLRFKLEPTGPFLNDDELQRIPPWTSLRELEQICLKLEEEDAIDDPNYLQWLNILIKPGSSLGGARPKAGISDPDNHLWIAKFPSKNDTEDTGAWEMVTYEMAVSARITMAESRVVKFSGNHHTFLTKRFDRTINGERIHFSSAMTQLGYADGADAAAGVSYLELVDFITNHGAAVKEDLHELWRRIVFSICVSNTDDHLRNHGFLLTNRGWRLSPAYDINPVESGTGLSLNINETDNALDLGLAMEVHEYFRLNKEEADQIVSQVGSAVRDWQKLASKYRITKAEQELKATAFTLI